MATPHQRQLLQCMYWSTTALDKQRTAVPSSILYWILAIRIRVWATAATDSSNNSYVLVCGKQTHCPRMNSSNHINTLTSRKLRGQVCQTNRGKKQRTIFFVFTWWIIVHALVARIHYMYQSVRERASFLIWVQTVCNVHQWMTKFAASKCQYRIIQSNRYSYHFEGIMRMRLDIKSVCQVQMTFAVLA